MLLSTPIGQPAVRSIPQGRVLELFVRILSSFVDLARRLVTTNETGHSTKTYRIPESKGAIQVLVEILAVLEPVLAPGLDLVARLW